MTEVRQQDDSLPLPGAKRTAFSFPASFDHRQIPLEEKRWPVIIIGSSMVGMTLGALLGYYAVESISFDRHPSTAIHPRAALFLLKTIEIFRQLGLEEQFRELSQSNFDLDAGMLMVDKLIGGKVLFAAQESDPVKVAQVTPCQRLWLTQNMFEPWLRGKAQSLGATQIFGTVVVHYEEREDGVLVVVQDLDTKEYRKYMTDFLVATDGNRSATREKENIEWHGQGHVSNALSINFKADLAPFLGTRAKHGVTYVNNPKIDAGFRIEAGGQKGFLIVTRWGETKTFAPDSITEKEAKQMFLDAAGLDQKQLDIEVEFISYWSVAAYTADELASKEGRVFVAGDAAHVMPPTGGMGGNTGILDCYNLAWKLAYVQQGHASRKLLKTYSEERQPAAHFQMTQAYSRLEKRVMRKQPTVPELDDIICELGHRYPSGAFVGTDQGKLWEDPYEPSAEPGARVPHVMLKGENGVVASTLDLIKSKFVVLASTAGSLWVTAAKHSKIPIEAYTLNNASTPYSDLDGSFAELAKLDSEAALLVRPDGIIGARLGATRSGHEKILQETLKQILSSD